VGCILRTYKSKPIVVNYALKHTLKHDINKQMIKVILMTVLLITVLHCIKKIGKNCHISTTLKEQELQQVLN
jgi:hypothetical protein